MRAKKLCAFSASRFFACLKTTPPFAIDFPSMNGIYLVAASPSCAARSIAWGAVFSLFAGECQCLALALPAKIHSFRPHSLILFRSFGKCARRILEATLAKCDFASLYYTSFCHMVILCWNKNANVSQYVVAKIWLKRNYISESYSRRWERWEKRSKRGEEGR